jgi:prepilin peptidase CpaA
MTAGIAVTLGTAIIAGVCDWRTSRIPNALTYSAIAIGLGLAVLTDSDAALWGLVTGAGIGLLLFVSGGLGGGDVKLIAAIGTLLGASRIIEVVAIAIAIAALLALAIVARAGLHRDLRAHLRVSLTSMAVPGAPRTSAGPNLRVQFAPALAVATALVVFVPAARFLAPPH